MPEDLLHGITVRRSLELLWWVLAKNLFTCKLANVRVGLPIQKVMIGPGRHQGITRRSVESLLQQMGYTGVRSCCRNVRCKDHELLPRQDSAILGG